MDINQPFTQPTIPGFRRVPRTGVIYVMHRARQHGFDYENKAWANLGQGSPEIGELPDAPDRINEVMTTAPTRHYSPIAGEMLLRERVANLYNELFRKGKSSQYTYENVSIAGGGRLSLTRLAAALDDINMGHFLPDYTAYEELLSTFKSFIPIPILLSADQGYQISADALRQEILGRGLNALLLSNPCNPTGQVIQDYRLRSWVETAVETGCSMIMDEHYSHFIYSETNNPHNIVTAAQFVDDVETAPILIVDGLTKNWRYPGFRISWTLGPKSVIETIASAGSFLDGGANHPFQIQASALLDPDYTLAETRAIQKAFKQKRDYVLERLHNVGITADAMPSGSFYIWANLRDLPEPLNNGMSFFEEGLKEQVITVPGVFFDVNPGHRRRTHARYGNYARVSFGPEMETLERGLDAIDRLVSKYRA